VVEMAKKLNTVLQELGITADSSTEEIIEILSDNSTIRTDELNNIFNISVKALPNQVKNKPDYVKQKMYGIVTDENLGFASIFNKRIAILSYLIGKIKMKTDELEERLDNGESGSGSGSGGSGGASSFDYYIGTDEPNSSVNLWIDTTINDLEGWFDDTIYAQEPMMMSFRRTEEPIEEQEPVVVEDLEQIVTVAGEDLSDSIVYCDDEVTLIVNEEDFIVCVRDEEHPIIEEDYVITVEPDSDETIVYCNEEYINIIEDDTVVCVLD
jgi:hypothetical protein